MTPAGAAGFRAVWVSIDLKRKDGVVYEKKDLVSCTGFDGSRDHGAGKRRQRLGGN